MSTEPTTPPKPTEPTTTARRGLSGTSVWLLVGGTLLLGVAVTLVLWLNGAAPRPATSAPERTIAAPTPAATDRGPAAPAPAERPKTYTQEELNVIKDLTRTEERNKIALEQQYGGK